MTDSPTLRQQLLAAADNWCRRTGRSHARLANLAGRHGRFFDDIAAGGDCTTEIYEHVMAFIRADLAARAARGALRETEAAE